MRYSDVRSIGSTAARKLTVHFFDVPSTEVVDRLLEERLLGLEDRLQIDAATARLEYRRELSPPFRVHVHVATPGPDLSAVESGHTLRAALEGALSQLDKLIERRELKRTRRLKGNLQAPATLRLPRSRG